MWKIFLHVSSWLTYILRDDSKLPQGFAQLDSLISLTAVSGEESVVSAGLPGCWWDGAPGHQGVGGKLVECCGG